MRTGFIIFFSIIIVVYTAINYYIFRRGCEAIPQAWNISVYYTILFIFVSASFLVGRFLERVWISDFTDCLVWIGSFWLGAMVYFFFIILILDFIRMINHFIPFLPSFLYTDYVETKMITGITAFIIVFLTIGGGYINAMIPRIVNLNFDINKKVAGLNELNAVVVTDIHLGTMFTRVRLDKIIAQINALNPDIILLGGDVVDEDVGPVIRQNLGGALKNLKSRYGTFAITGNHEYIGGAEKACKYLSEHGVILLRDTTVTIDNKFILVGREDRSKSGFSGVKRKTLDELMINIDKSKPIILLDHQPFELDKAAASGADVQFSGHTHNGQMFPFNFITKMIYEVSWGYLKKGNTHFYVSSGLGTWGPPIKIGNIPEILNVKLTFMK